MASENWTKAEVLLIIADYFGMLQSELVHAAYNKAEHRKALIMLLNNRSNGSIEFKHQNISAVLLKLGLPFIKGYKPRFNYQQILEEEVCKFLSDNRLLFEQRFDQFSNEVVSMNLQMTNFESFLDSEPETSILKEAEPAYRTIKTNYLEKEQNNRSLGEEGEKLVIAYEKYRLLHAGKNSLIDKIEWTSKEYGDGAGYDIYSKNVDGSDRFIEVKTTKLTKETPIYLTKTELSFAASHSSQFYLYRVFDFNSSPKAFIRNGQYGNFCNLTAQTFKGYFK